MGTERVSIIDFGFVASHGFLRACDHRRRDRVGRPSPFFARFFIFRLYSILI